MEPNVQPQPTTPIPYMQYMQTSNEPVGQNHLGGTQPSMPKLKKWLWAVFSLILLVALFFTPIPYYQNKTICTLSYPSSTCNVEGWHLDPSLFTRLFVQLQQNSQNIPTPTITQIPSPTPDPTVSWKKYADPNNKFSFKYPPDLPATISYLNIVSKDYLTGAELRSEVTPGTTLKGHNLVFNLSIEVWKNTQSITNFQRKQNLLSVPTPVAPYGERIKNITDYRNGVIDGVYYEIGSDQTNANIVGEINDQYYKISFNEQGVPPAGETRVLIDQILQTFKFTDQEQSVLLPDEIKDFPKQ